MVTGGGEDRCAAHEAPPRKWQNCSAATLLVGPDRPPSLYLRVAASPLDTDQCSLDKHSARICCGSRSLAASCSTRPDVAEPWPCEAHVSKLDRSTKPRRSRERLWHEMRRRDYSCARWAIACPGLIFRLVAAAARRATACC
jgi:hypothetical protein